MTNAQTNIGDRMEVKCLVTGRIVASFVIGRRGVSYDCIAGFSVKRIEGQPKPKKLDRSRRRPVR